MKKDLSIIVPSIRPQFLDMFYESATLACKKYSFEMVIPGPYDVPADGQTADTLVFNQLYSDPNIVSKRIKIPYDNWKNQPDVWVRRFNTTPLHTTRGEYEATLPDYQPK